MFVVSKSMTKTQVKSWLLNFNYSGTIREIEKAEVNSPNSIKIYGLDGVMLRYAGNGRYYISLGTPVEIYI